MINVNEALNCIMTVFGRVDASAQPCRTAKPRRTVPTFFEMKKEIPSSLLAPAISFFALELVDDTENIPSTMSHELYYEPTRRKVPRTFTDKII